MAMPLAAAPYRASGLVRWREADIRQGATRGLGAKFAELVEASALGPGRDAIESKTVPNSCALIISPLHSKQYQIF
jgi:hypothetical protein